MKNYRKISIIIAIALCSLVAANAQKPMFAIIHNITQETNNNYTLIVSVFCPVLNGELEKEIYYLEKSNIKTFGIIRTKRQLNRKAKKFIKTIY